MDKGLWWIDGETASVSCPSRNRLVQNGARPLGIHNELDHPTFQARPLAFGLADQRLARKPARAT